MTCRHDTEPLQEQSASSTSIGDDNQDHAAEAAVQFAQPAEGTKPPVKVVHTGRAEKKPGRQIFCVLAC